MPRTTSTRASQLVTAATYNAPSMEAVLLREELEGSESDNGDDMEDIAPAGGEGDCAPPPLSTEDTAALTRLLGEEGGATEVAMREHAAWASCVFDFFDCDGDGVLNYDEFNALQRETGSETVPRELWEDTCTAFGCAVSGFDLAGLLHGYELTEEGALEADYAAVQLIIASRAASGESASAASGGVADAADAGPPSERPSG